MLTSNRTYLDLIDFDANYWFKAEIGLQRIQISLLIVPKGLSLSLRSHEKFNEVVKLFIVFSFFFKYQSSANVIVIWSFRWHVTILMEHFFFFIFSYFVFYPLRIFFFMIQFTMEPIVGKVELIPHVWIFG